MGYGIYSGGPCLPRETTKSKTKQKKKEKRSRWIYLFGFCSGLRVLLARSGRMLWRDSQGLFCDSERALS